MVQQSKEAFLELSAGRPELFIILKCFWQAWVHLLAVLLRTGSWSMNFCPLLCTQINASKTENVFRLLLLYVTFYWKGSVQKVLLEYSFVSLKYKKLYMFFSFSLSIF